MHERTRCNSICCTPGTQGTRWVGPAGLVRKREGRGQFFEYRGVGESEVTDCTAATSHSSRATQTRGGCIGSAVLRLCSLCVSKSGNRESGVGVTVASLGASVALLGFRSFSWLP